MTRVVGGYAVVRQVGRGGMAIVYLARQEALDREVALKELSSFQASEPEMAQRFLRESRLAGSLNHPNIVTVYEYFEEGGIPYIAMEYLSRGSLRPYVGQLSLAQFAGVMEGVLAGLAYAETKAIVHRDLKPENLLVTSDGRVKIADFGIAKATQSATTGLFTTAAGTTVGTPAYMAPEQAMAGDIGIWTDLYSVGVMAWEHLVGRVPFHDTEAPMAILMRHVNEPIAPAVELEPATDPDVSGWVDRLLVKDPSERTRSPTTAWAELEESVVGTLGPLWRRDARVPDETQALETSRPLTPAPFESQRGATPAPPVQAHAEQADGDYLTFGAAEPKGPDAEPASPPPPAPVLSAGAPEATRTAEAGEAPAALPRTLTAPPATEPRLATTVLKPSIDRPEQGMQRAATARRSRRGPLASAGLLLAAAIVAAVIVVSGGSKHTGRPAPRPAPSGDHFVIAGTSTIPGIVAATGITVDSRGTVWVTDGEHVKNGNYGITPHNNSVTPIDPMTSMPGSRIDVGLWPRGIAVGSSALWITNRDSSTVTRLDPVRRSVIQPPIVVGSPGDDPDGVAVGFGDVWVAGNDTNPVPPPCGCRGSLWRISPQQGVVKSISPGAFHWRRPIGVAAGPSAIWVTNHDDGSVMRIDPDTLGVSRIPVGRGPAAVAVAQDGTVWIANFDGNSVSVLDPTGNHLATIGVGKRPAGIAVGFGYVWVTDQADDSVSVIDLRRRAVVPPSIPVGHHPTGIAVGSDAVWVADRDSNTVTRIGVRRG